MSKSFIPFGSTSYWSQDRHVASISSPLIHIVDDMADHVHFLSVGLEAAGYSAKCHKGVESFTRAISTGDASAVVIDVRLQDGDGMDVLDAIRRSGQVGIDIVLMSGDPSSLLHCRRYAEEIGLKVTAVLNKPFTVRQLIDTLKAKETTLHSVLSQIDIENSLDKGWVYPVFQPKLCLGSGRIKSAELLSRVAHPEFGVIPPQAFISALLPEQAQRLFLHNMSVACREFGWGREGMSDIAINVNIDGHSLSRLRDQIRSISMRTPDFFKRVVFEITEDAMAQLRDDDLKGLFKLTMDGAQFSIDDFGAGHSNFARLSRLPFTEIKIDRSLVRECYMHRTRQIMVRSIVALAHDMGARVVAEGVETADELAFLEDAGCDEVQGYLIARPMKMQQFMAFVSEFNGGARRERVRMQHPNLATA